MNSIRVRRGLAAVSVVAMSGALLAAPADAVQPAAARCASGAPLASDFDGDRAGDLVVGGYLGDDRSLSDRVQPGDGGPATWLRNDGGLVSADLDGDTCADAILAPGQAADRRTGGGTVRLVPGTADGLDVSSAVDIPIPQELPTSDSFVYSQGFVAAGLRHDGLSQVAVAVNQFEDDGDGEVFLRAHLDIFTIDPTTLEVTDTQVIDLPGQAGEVAADGKTIAMGLPATTVGGDRGAGAVRLYTPSADAPGTFVARTDLSQSSAGVPGASEPGDHFGATLAFRDGRLAIGTPEDKLGNSRLRFGIGSVHPILWNESALTYTAYRRIDQGASGVPGSNEEDDRFGSTLAIARGLTASGSYDIVIGAEGEADGSKRGSGSFTVASFTRSIYRAYSQATAGVPGSPETDDGFGVAGLLRNASGIDTVVVGAPGEDAAQHAGGGSFGYAVRSDGKRLGSKTAWTVVAKPTDGGADVSRWGAHAASSTGPYIITGE